MTFLGAFDATTVEARKGFDALPVGDYAAVIVNNEMKTSQKGGQYLKLEIDIVEGDYKGRKLFVNLNLVNDNPKAVTIAQQELAEICLAVSKPQIQDSSEIVGIRFMVSLGVKASTYNVGEMENKIKKYYAYDAAKAAAPAEATTSAFG